MEVKSEPSSTGAHEQWRHASSVTRDTRGGPPCPRSDGPRATRRLVQYMTRGGSAGDSRDLLGCILGTPQLLLPLPALHVLRNLPGRLALLLFDNLLALVARLLLVLVARLLLVRGCRVG